MNKNLIIFIMLLLFSIPAGAATLTVTNCADSGAGSLRQALSDANDGDEIVFDITTLEAGYSTGEAGPGLVTNEAGSNTWFRIITNNYLDIMDNYLVIKGSSQTREANNSLGPKVEIRTSANINIFGAYRDYTTIEGFVLNRFDNNNYAAIRYNSADHNHVYGCYIGTTATGEALPPAKFGYGIQLVGSHNNLIGGTNTNQRNIISGTTNNGIYASNALSNKIYGNYFGFGRDGQTVIVNSHSIYLQDTCQSNIIGTSEGNGGNLIIGDNEGILFENATVNNNFIYNNIIGLTSLETIPGTQGGDGIVFSLGSNNNHIGGTGTNEGNVISGHTGRGIYMQTSNTNEVLGNYIGTDFAGTADRGNGSYGVLLVNASHNNKIGNGNTGGMNIISGNGSSGIYLGGVGVYYNEILGNYIGTDINGTADLGNTQNGVVFYIGTRYNKIGNSTTGGRNIISGNDQSGLLITGSGTISNEVLGNFIGTDVIGTASLANAGHGVYISSNAQQNKIGDGTSNGKNIISGNAGNGLRIEGTDTNSNEVKGNYIGTDSSGTAAQGNGSSGLFITDEASYNVIGGDTTFEGNVISGNSASDGIYIQNTNTTGTIIKNNIIGLDASQSIKLPNQIGIEINNAGDTQVGATGMRGNTISGNSAHGIWIHNCSSNIQVLQNIIGSNYPAFASDLGNDQHGIYLSSCSNVTIGGNSSLEANLIVSNGNDANDHGIYINSGSSNNVTGNYIGVTPAISGPPIGIGNTGDGIRIEGSNGNIIGATTYEAWNFIASNEGSGIYLMGDSDSNTFIGNNIGFAFDNNGNDTAFPNKAFGIYIGSLCNLNTVGTTELSGAGRNVISNSNYSGIVIAGDNNEIYGNLIGTTSSGEAIAPNGDDGIIITGNNNLIGSSGGKRNIISSNGDNGIHLNYCLSNEVKGNYIGLNFSGSNALANSLAGIEIEGGAQYNIIGGTNLGEGNIISGNTQNGILITDTNTNSNEVLGNIIGLDATGTTAIANQDNGIYIATTANYNKIGDGTLAGLNIISGNNDAPNEAGIKLNSASYTQIYGNFIGTDIYGTAAAPNTQHGIYISGGNWNEIGSALAAIPNVISGNNNTGINLTGTNQNTQIKNNIIGLNVTGDSIIQNNTNGINIANARTCIIGGTTAAEGNIISGNGLTGIFIATNSQSNEVIGNYIGVGANGTTDFGNADYGLHIYGPSQIIGPNNTIAYNGDSGAPDGIRLDGTSAQSIVITQNSIYENYDKGINLVAGANSTSSTPEVITANHDEITGLTQITGESAPANGTVEVFLAQGNQGKTYLGSTLANASGNWLINVAGLVSGDAVTATGTTPNPETSEFSPTKEVVTTAFALYQPDGLACTLESGADYIGEGVFAASYETTTQIIESTKSTNETFVFYVKVINSGNTSDEIKVEAAASSMEGWDGKIYDSKTGSNEITTQAVTTGWYTPTLASGESTELRFELWTNLNELSTLEAWITLTSSGDANQKDVVKAILTAVPIPPPPSDLTSFDISLPGSTIQGAPFNATITARDSGGAVEDLVIGATQLLVDSGTISPTSIAESGFSSGLWSGNITLDTIGQRTITVSNEGSIGTATILVTNATIEYSATDLGVTGMSITIPGGAASSEVSLTATEITNVPENSPPAPGYQIGGTIIDITGTPTTFMIPVTVTLPINDPLVAPTVRYWNGTEWSSDGITVVSYTDTSITFTTTHFSMFAVMAPLSSNLVRFGPNPYNPNLGQMAKIWYYLPADSATSIYIVSANGTLIWKNSYGAGINGGRAGENIIDFNGKDRWGNVLGDGVYIYKIVQGGKAIGGGKIAIIK